MASIIICCSAVFAQEAPPAKVVITKIVQEEVTENRSFIGTFYYERVSHVSSEVSGLVEKVEVSAGDQVKEGATIIHLDTELLDKEISIQKNLIKQMDLNIENTEKNYKRLDLLYKNEGVSEKDFDDAKFSYQNALLEKQSAEKKLDKLLIQKRKSVIKAPFDSVVLEKNVDTGDWVQQGKQLVSLGSTNDLFIKVPVAETILRFIAIGQKVLVMVDALNKEISGSIDGILPSADPKTRNVFLKVRIPVLQGTVENMSATAFIATSDKKKLSIIPRDALIKFQGKDFIYTVKEEKASILPVNIVSYLEDKIGADNPYLMPGMVVVVEGNERLRPDQPVVVAGEK